MSFVNELKWRGLINNITNQTKIEWFDNNEGTTAYIGFDPSADSLHLGNYIMLMVLRHLKNHGHNAIAIIGGATGKIGDPSGKKAERKMLDTLVTKKNALAIARQIKKNANVETFNNENIYRNMTLFDFLRNAGKFINVNYLLEKEIIKSRLEIGISYSEFSYNLIQGYDFAWLYKNKDITLQIGGSDQFGNITTGVEMIRKMYGDDNKACGLTINLLTKADGAKFGKSESGAIYLSPKKTSSFAMYQFLFNQADADIEKLLKCLTMLSQQTIEEIIVKHKAEPFKRLGQKKLAQTVVEDIHGVKEYQRCVKISDALFGGKIESLQTNELYDALNTLTTFIATDNQYNIIDLLITIGVTKSRSEARTLIETKVISCNNKIIDNFNFIVTKKDSLNQKFSYIRKGKKNYFLIKWK